MKLIVLVTPSSAHRGQGRLSGLGAVLTFHLVCPHLGHLPVPKYTVTPPLVKASSIACTSSGIPWNLCFFFFFQNIEIPPLAVTGLWGMSIIRFKALTQVEGNPRGVWVSYFSEAWNSRSSPALTGKPIGSAPAPELPHAGPMA